MTCWPSLTTAESHIWPPLYSTVPAPRFNYWQNEAVPTSSQVLPYLGSQVLPVSS